MKKLLLFLFFIVFIIGHSAFADHVIGYDMNLINIKNAAGQPTNMYKVRVKFFRDMSGIPIPTTFTFNIYKNSDHTQVGPSITTPKINPANSALTYEDGDCAPAGFSGQRIEFGLYESIPVDLSALNDPAGYYMSDEICCRNIGIINTEGGPGSSSMYSLTLTMDFPRLDAFSPYKYNSSPEFVKAPLTYFCVGKPYTINWNITDPDNTPSNPKKDSLVFSLAQPLNGELTKPWSDNEIPYAPGYNLYYNVADGAPDISIDARTGIINFIPTKQGKYLVAFKCQEYRNGVRIGEVRREFQMETTICPDAPPVTEDVEHRSRYITDTVYFGDPNFSMTFTSVDAPTDSLTMEYVQTIQDNLVNQGALFEDPTIPGIQTWKIEDVYTVKGRFKWNPGCEDIRPAPYKFYVVVHDRTCPSPFYDTTYVTLYVKSKTNYSPFFISPDTFENKHVQRYFIQAGNQFVLDGSNILKAIDTNTFTQNVVIQDLPDILDPSDFRNEYSFNMNPGDREATATFQWTPDCAMIRPEPYKIQFIAYDDDCFPDTAELNVELYVIPAFNQIPVMQVTNSTHPFIGDSVTAKENETLQFTMKVVDTTNLDSNSYRHLTVGLFNHDRGDFDASMKFDDVSHIDSVSGIFEWPLTCANVREQPYILRVFAHDHGCPDSLFVYREIKIRVLGPVNTAPYFPKAPANKLVQATVEAGKTYTYPVFAQDTNARFHIISVKGEGEIFSSVTNIASFANQTNPDSVKGDLVWETACADVRPAPYLAEVIAIDNACGIPATDTLRFEIMVTAPVNDVPLFIDNSVPSPVVNIDLTIQAGDNINIPLEAQDPDPLDILTIDTVYTTIPQTMTRPSIDRKQGQTNVNTSLIWNTDCSNIGGPYLIKVGAWDNACRVNGDSSETFIRVTIEPNPDFQPSLNISDDTTITIVAGEQYQFKIESTNSNPLATDSIMIGSSGDIFGNIPGEFAVLKQTDVSGTATADLTWNTSCDQIKETPYIIKIYASNPECQVNDTIDVNIMVVPNTDVTEELPNVFTPNGDGKNDTYTIKENYKVYCDPSFTFRVFNRWGKKVFESKNPEFEWSGDNLASGTYFYTITSRVKTQSGTLNLIR